MSDLEKILKGSTPEAIKTLTLAELWEMLEECKRNEDAELKAMIEAAIKAKDGD